MTSSVGLDSLRQPRAHEPQELESMKRDSLARGLLVVALLAPGCGPSTPAISPQPSASASATTSAAGEQVPPADPFALEGLLHEEWLPLLSGPAPAFADVVFPTTPKNVPAPPPNACNAWVARPLSTGKAVACADKTAALDLLDKAMAEKETAVRDAALALLEPCEAFEAGVIRALRIDLGPEECGDVMAEPLLVEKPGTPKPQGKREIPGVIEHTLIGQVLAARLHRAVNDPPKLDPPYTMERVTAFNNEKLFPWYTDQAVAVHELTEMGNELNYYGHGIAGIAAGTADLRIVEAAREAPIPDDFRANADALNDYYSNLDLKLEPRKQRGTKAALTGLEEMAHAGVIEDRRVDVARELVAKAYGGRRVDALDPLRLSPPRPLRTDTVLARLAATLPTFFLGMVLDASAATDPAVLENMRDRGVPTPFRVALKAAKLGDAEAVNYAHARLRMGTRYWRASDFDACAAILTNIGRDKLAPEALLELGVAIALRNGPDSIRLLMGRESLPPTFGQVGALDAIAADEKNAGIRGVAAFDGAVVFQLTIPRIGADHAPWLVLAKRYTEALPLITDPELLREAQGRLRAAEETAKAVKSAK